MRTNRLFLLVLLFLFLFSKPTIVLAQSYEFELPSQTIDYFINSDGTASINYIFNFVNSPSGVPIQYVDVGIPNSNFVDSSISADIDGTAIYNISRSDFQGDGSGVAINLENNAIPSGGSGTVTVFIGTVNRVLFPDTEDPAYTSTNFVPSFFGSVQGQTDTTVRIHFPEGVQPDQPRWHQAPKGWVEEPETGFDEQGRIMYTWNNPSAAGDQAYEFGVSFPSQFVPSESISQPTVAESVEDSFGIQPDTFISYFMCCGGAVFIGLIIFASYRSTQKRKLQYLSPKIAIEGHGIKRGLTAVEAAILLEQPVDKILTMILFGLIKKEVVAVITRDPLELNISEDLPPDLHPFETDFIQAFKEQNKTSRQRLLQNMMVELVKSVSNNMKGFSRKETIEYYREIMTRAWGQVTAADTPEIKMDKYSENLEWTMLDKDYEEKTRDVFQTGPVFIPHWWPRYDPTISIPKGASSAPSIKPGSSPSVGGGGITMPQLPGSAFAASMITGAQNFSKGVVGNITEFTGAITNKTNPVPQPTRTSSSTWKSGGSSGGRSCACACACACAGCACACAGGGR
jgi:hypothetical protein